MMKRSLVFLVAAAVSVTAYSQNAGGYFVGKNFVSYNDSLMSAADVTTFEILGHGFAKDKAHVYNAGKIMEYVDPATFTVKKEDGATSSSSVSVTTTPATDSDDGNSTFLDRLLGTDDVANKYVVSNGTVTYDGRAVKKADAATFRYVGGDYAADRHHAYYKGRILGDAWGAGQFTYKGNGYASDGVHWYCNGKPVDRD